METLDHNIIFSQKFPDAYPLEILKKTEELIRADPAAGKEPSLSFEELLKQIEEDDTYEPRPDAEKKSETFISHAIAVCRNFEIDTEITRRRYGIDVVMDLDCGWYGGEVKRALTSVLKLADEFDLSCNQSRPDCIRVSMTYHTHDRYIRGEKAKWL